jgi:hypothetical protein
MQARRGVARGVKRRPTLVAALLAALVTALGAAPAWAQTVCPGTAAWTAAWASLRTATHQIAIAALPSPPPVGRHFRLEVHLCQGSGPVKALRVDADMPAHRHGMNYRTTVKALGAGRWQAEGLLFHMPGRWRFLVELDTPQGTQRFTHELEVQ